MVNANTFQSEKKVQLSDKTIKNYLDYICDSFLVEKSQRYDIKGKKQLLLSLVEDKSQRISNMLYIYAVRTLVILLIFTY